jgi:hypothetical protein
MAALLSFVGGASGPFLQLSFACHSHCLRAMAPMAAWLDTTDKNLQDLSKSYKLLQTDSLRGSLQQKCVVTLLRNPIVSNMNNIEQLVS